MDVVPLGDIVGIVEGLGQWPVLSRDFTHALSTCNFTACIPGAVAVHGQNLSTVWIQPEVPDDFRLLKIQCMNLQNAWHQQPTPSRLACPPPNLPTFAEIRARLDHLLPPPLTGGYITDATLAECMGVAHKTLLNQRTAQPSRYLHPLKLFGNKTGVHVRDDVLDWLANEELRARNVLHRCR